MNGFDFLDLVIGLIFIYLIYSIACSAVWEIIINLSHLRGRMLYNWLKVNFGKGDLYDKIAGHALVKGMSRPKKKSVEYKRPNYISSGIFTEVLLDLVVHEDKNSLMPVDINALKASLVKTNLIEDDLKRVFLQYISEASGSLLDAKEMISKWFDETQERLIGSFKKKVQGWIFIISFVLVAATNADTIKLADYLYNNDDARKAIADQAVEFVRDTASLSKIKAMDTLVIDSAARRDQKEIIEKVSQDINALKDLDKDLKKTGIPIGWTKEALSEMKQKDNIRWDKLFIKTGGLLLTIFAVSVGSPFWFDMLSKLTNLRATGKKPKSLLDPEDEK